MSWKRIISLALLLPLAACTQTRTVSTAVAPTGRHITPAQSGPKGDGTSDDSLALQALIDSGKSLALPPGIYRVTQRLLFRASDVVYSAARDSDQAGPVVLLFDGPFTERLADISGVNVTFRGIVFSGGYHQVRGTMVYAKDDARGLTFEDCTFENIRGTHADGTSVKHDPASNTDITYLNLGSLSGNQYALMISPYGITDLVIRRCRFQHLRNDNTGLNGSPVRYGSGFVGGIFFERDDFGARTPILDLPAGMPYVPTSGIIEDSIFHDIQTSLKPGLDLTTALTLNDADAIRTYGAGVDPAAPGLDLPVTIRNVTFSLVGKRAIKTAQTSGIVVENVTIDSRGLPYPMANAIRLASEMKVDGVQFIADATTPVQSLFDSRSIHDVIVKNVTATHAFVVWTMVAPANDAHAAMRRVYADNVTVDNVYYGGLYGTADAGSNARFVEGEDLEFSRFTLTAASGAHSVTGVSGPVLTACGPSGLTLERFTLRNMDLKVGGSGIVMRDVSLLVDDPQFAGFNATRGLVEIGTGVGKGDSNNVVERLTVKAPALAPDFLNNTRQNGLILLYGDGARYSDIRLEVPQALTTAVAHLNVYGSRLLVDGFDYYGPGTATISATGQGPYSDVTLHHFRRHAAGTDVTNNAFLYLSKGMRHVISDVRDCRAGAGVYSIRLLGGLPSSPSPYAYYVNDVLSRSPIGALYDHGNPDGSPLASRTDVLDRPNASLDECDD